jgi:diguanylate cyclase (GGDEF)-like protein
MKQTVLLIKQDSPRRSEIIKRLKEHLSNIDILVADNFKQATQFILDKDTEIHISIVDVVIANHIIRFITKEDIPTIILTDRFDDNTKEIISKFNLSDYVIKENINFFKQIVYSVHRILKNYSTKVLVVDDSLTQLQVAVDILKKNKLNITTASNGEEAYRLIQENEYDQFALVLTDYNMPKMDGLELTLKIRENYDKDELGIIVLSSVQSPEISSEFIKLGANDFINKPYSQIEVVTRVNSNLDILELFQTIRDMAYKDFLTGSYNRRYFYDLGESIFLKAKRENKNLCVAMFDIDKFKNINDTYGHDVGDIALQEIAKILKHNLRCSDLIARFGGEEFCVLLENISIEDAKKLFEKIRVILENNVVKAFEHKIQYTVSIGIYYGLENKLETMIKKADDKLYYCKNNGRNQIAIN